MTMRSKRDAVSFGRRELPERGIRLDCGELQPRHALAERAQDASLGCADVENAMPRSQARRRSEELRSRLRPLVLLVPPDVLEGRDLHALIEHAVGGFVEVVEGLRRRLRIGVDQATAVAAHRHQAHGIAVRRRERDGRLRLAQRTGHDLEVGG